MIRNETREENVFQSNMCSFDGLVARDYPRKMNGVCETSLYHACRCKEKYHLSIGLLLYNAHCHIDLFFNYGLDRTELIRQLSDGRRMTFIDSSSSMNSRFQVRPSIRSMEFIRNIFLPTWNRQRSC